MGYFSGSGGAVQRLRVLYGWRADAGRDVGRGSVERLVRRHGSIYRRHSASTSILVRAVGFPSKSFLFLTAATIGNYRPEFDWIGAVGSSATGAEHFDQCLPDGELAGHDVDSVRRLHGIRYVLAQLTTPPW